VYLITRARAAALLFGGAALGATRYRGRAQTGIPVRIATFAVENAMGCFYAKDAGFFAKAGIDADVQIMQGGSAVVAAVVSNAIDIGYSAFDTLAAIHQKGVPLVVIAPGPEYLSPATTHDAALVVAENSTIHQAKDLNGKIVATNTLHSLSDIAPRLWMDQNGGDSTTVKFVEVPFSAMSAALEAGRIDAGWIVEPSLGVVKNGRVVFYGYDVIAKHFLLGAWFTTAQWAKDHSDAVKRFAAAIRETAAWANKNPEKSGEILAKYTKIDPSVIAMMVRAHFADQLTPALMQPLIDVSAKYNGFARFPAEELLYTPPRAR
jgi:NitT/TauT family transport system substrate-binding protein